MDYSTVALMKKIAAKNFRLKKAKFNNFEKIDIDEVKDLPDDEVDDLMAHVEVWANYTIEYDGDPPDSYRVLNAMIQDWVDSHEKELKKEVNPNLIAFLNDQYKYVDTSDLNKDFDDYIWEDQVDYMPEIDEDKNEINFVIELVLDVAEEEQDED